MIMLSTRILRPQSACIAEKIGLIHMHSPRGTDLIGRLAHQAVDRDNIAVI